MPTLGLVVSGGGARGAYQAGVLAAIGDICAELKINQPFKIYTSVSAGAINSCFLTCYEGNFAEGSQRLLDIWKSLKSENIFISNPVVLAEGGLEWLAALSFGGMKKNVKGKSLLNTSPLHELIIKNCDFRHLATRIERKEIAAFGVTALDYYSSSSVTFVQGDPQLKPWERVRRKSEATIIQPEHLMASAAIPLLFSRSEEHTSELQSH